MHVPELTQQDTHDHRRIEHDTAVETKRRDLPQWVQVAHESLTFALRSVDPSIVTPEFLQQDANAPNVGRSQGSEQLDRTHGAETGTTCSGTPRVPRVMRRPRALPRIVSPCRRATALAETSQRDASTVGTPTPNPAVPSDASAGAYEPGAHELLGPNAKRALPENGAPFCGVLRLGFSR